MRLFRADYKRIYAEESEVVHKLTRSVLQPLN